MNKPKFDPNKPFKPVEKPPFNPSASFQPIDNLTAGTVQNQPPTSETPRDSVMRKLERFVESGRTPESPQTLPEVATSLTRLVTPPKSLQDLMLEKPMQAEELGQTVKQSVKGVIGKTAKDFPVLEKIGEVSTDIVPFTPSGFTGMAGGDVLAAPIQDALKSFPTKIANRFFKQAANAAVKRMGKGEPTLGEEVLFSPDLKEFRIDDKKKIFDIAQNRIKESASKIGDAINAVGEKGVKIDKNSLIDETVFKNVLDDMIPDFESFSPDRKSVALLKSIKSSKDLTFKQANELRELLGREINRKFLSPEETLSPVTEAQKAIWESLRTAIGSKSPKIDQLLKKQHVLYEISNAVAKDAAAGIGASNQLMASGGAMAGGAAGAALGGVAGATAGAPLGMAVGILSSRLSRSMGFAGLVKKLLDAQGVGGAIATAGAESVKNIKRGRKND